MAAKSLRRLASLLYDLMAGFDNFLPARVVIGHDYEIVPGYLIDSQGLHTGCAPERPEPSRPIRSRLS